MTQKKGSLWPYIRLIWVFTLPLIATSVLQLLFNTADTLVVGRFGGDSAAEREAELAAVGSCGALINLIVNTFMGLSIGSGVIVARSIGAGDRDRVDDTLHTSVAASLFLGIFVAVGGFFLSRTFLVWMGTDPAVLDSATSYMRAYFCGVPAAMVYNFCAAILRSAGDTKHPLVFLTAGGVLNVFLNLLMVLGFRLGAVGVGIATAASNWVACILVVVFMMKTEGYCRLDAKKIRLHMRTFGDIMALGVPAGLQNFVFSASNVLIQSSVNSFNSVSVVAGNTAAATVEGYVYVAQNSFSQAAMTYAGQFSGAGRYDKVGKVSFVCLASAFLTGGMLGGAATLFGKPLLELFCPGNEDAVAVGFIRLCYICLPYFLCGLMDVFGGLLRGLGKSVSPAVSSMIFACAFRVLWLMTVFRAVHIPEMIYISYPLSWFLTTLCNGILFFVEDRKQKKKAAVTA